MNSSRHFYWPCVASCFCRSCWVKTHIHTIYICVCVCVCVCVCMHAFVCVYVCVSMCANKWLILDCDCYIAMLETLQLWAKKSSGSLEHHVFITSSIWLLAQSAGAVEYTDCISPMSMQDMTLNNLTVRLQ